MAKQPKTTREQMIQEMIIKMANSKEHRFDVSS